MSLSHGGARPRLTSPFPVRRRNRLPRPSKDPSRRRIGPNFRSALAGGNAARPAGGGRPRRGLAAAYLQVGHPFLEGLRVVPQQTLLLQELGVVAVGGRLEEAVVQHVPQRLRQGAEHLLLRPPHGRVRVKPETLLREGGREGDGEVSLRWPYPYPYPYTIYRKNGILCYMCYFGTMTVANRTN